MIRRDPATFFAHLLAGAVASIVVSDATAAKHAEVVTRISEGNQRYWVEEVVVGLNLPSSMAWLPNGDMLVTERTGDLRIVRNGKLDPEPVSGTPASRRGEGLKDVLLDPDFRTNQTLYFLISEGDQDRLHAAVYRGRYSASGLKDVRAILHAKNEGGYAYFASRMIFLADNTLLIAIPEDHHAGAQQLSSHKGKILRINRDGSVPEDNPFRNTPGALPEIWSYGHRVPLGLYQESITGVIWEVEAGPRGGDELNMIKPGGNYGWAMASWGFAYGNNGLDTPVQSGRGIEDPILVWTPSVTPSGLARYHGEMYPLWNGDYFLGHLTNKALERIRIEDRRVVLQERMLLDLEERIRDVKVGPDGHLYLLTDHQNGRVLRLRAGTPRGNELARVAGKLEHPAVTTLVTTPKDEEEISSMGPQDISKGRQAFLERCAACHGIGTIVPGGEIGPDLSGVYGGLMGRKAGFDYSPTMSDSPTVWDFAMLDRFLANPSVLPGTRMASPPVMDAQMRRHIIGFLKQQSPR